MRGHVRKRGNKWVAVVYVGYDEKGKDKYKWFSGFNTKKEAERFMAEQIRDMNHGTFIEPSKKTVGAYMQEWLRFKETQVRLNTYLGYESKARMHIIPELGKVQLAGLRPKHIQDFYTKLLHNPTPPSLRSILHIHRILHDAIDSAVKWELIPRNVVEAVDPPKVPKIEMKVWDREQVLRFLDAAKENRWYTLFLLAITTGMRSGELLGLRWEDIDFEGATLTVRRTMSFVDSKKTLFEPKTERSRRIISLPSETVKTLKKHRVRQLEEKLFLRDRYEDNGFVNTRDNGVVPHPTSIRQQFNKICTSADIPIIRLHDLRHTHATMLFEQKEHPKVVSERLGHSTIGTTLDIYTHVLPSIQEQAAAKFNDNLFGKKKITDK